MNGKCRKIKFKLDDVDKTSLKSVGVYKLINIVNGHFYIGSTFRNFRERFKEHCATYMKFKEGGKIRSTHPILWAAYDKYGIENFKVEILEIMDDASDAEIRDREEYYIRTLKPEYNICKYPSKGGIPNLGRKLSKEWKEAIREKSSQYKHSEDTLKIVTKNNKDNAVKLKFIKDNEILEFNSWVEAAKHFKIKSNSAIRVAYNKGKTYKGYIIEKQSKQSKSIRIYKGSEILEFQTLNECDRHFNMWRGYTSTLINRKDNRKFLEQYDYELI